MVISPNIKKLLLNYDIIHILDFFIIRVIM